MNITLKDIQQYIVDNIQFEVNSESSDPPKATIKVTVPGVFSVKGFMLKESKFEHKKLGDFVWIQPTSVRKADGKFMEVFWFEDKKLWDIVERKIYDAFLKVTNKNNE
ncbi:MAG: hypothetical protein US86_C0002G0066 [Candidatus Daviesbacteria bacterium GW2011_GWA2_38_24]|uniref:Uncharacterized protein n=1 Tax=Candidatus Daviesbacteria bacterium GW2011_GWA2_38_24 TaxID=1618422 RepID=A0A0G0LZW7_9BACT|nr:MAG: hypothetical protein US86_C0002G0066 [Candidatus Daviesbacteria bacterium GW2011_GWA2_38_24]KKQ79967.1 MAG: hypothetical protein UT01_C0023G0006 [Candidatus Daviesbacteria bacterium GW2011_GWA1_38_7]